MDKKTRVGIVGYGNLGQGVELALQQTEDLELVAIFSRRVGSAQGKMQPMSQLAAYRDRLEVLVLCGGSATDLPAQGPEVAQLFSTVDSFDNHKEIPAYYAAMDQAARAGGNLALISCGWDPGLFSLYRVLAMSSLPQGQTYTFWGPGLSQGHSDAIRRVPGVADARQYTQPVTETVEQVMAGAGKDYTAREMHWRDCYVVAGEGADRERIAAQIEQMPNYFAPYDTRVNFVSQEQLKAEHSGMPHGGMVIRSGQTGGLHEHRLEYKVTMADNPQFTASILVAFARAAASLRRAGRVGAITPLDVPIAALAPLCGEDLRRSFL